MENKTQNTMRQRTLELIPILLLAGALALTFRPQSPTQLFFAGVLVGILIGYLMIFIYWVGKAYRGKRP